MASFNSSLPLTNTNTGSSPRILKPSFDLGGRVSHPLRAPEMASSSYSTKKTNSASIFDDEEDEFYEDECSGKRASLMEEFTRDEVGASSNKFKSSFAREVVQNVRLSMSAQSPESGRRRRNSRRLTNGSPEDISMYASFLSGHDKYEHRRGSEGRNLSSSISRRSNSSSGARRALISDGIPSPCSSDESLAWNTQPSNLEVDSLLEGGGDITPTSSSDCYSSSLKKSSHSKLGRTRASLESLKKACVDLDLNLNELDWIGIRNYLLDRDQLNDRFVVNEDFFNAYNYIMSNKRKDRLDKKKINPKESMKSDSGGEMESSRSSDEEEEVRTGGLHESDAVLHQEEKQTKSTQKDISSVYEDLSQKETELLKLRVDFNALSEEKENYKQKYESLKARLRENDSKLKEVEHLKWQLKTLENSRKTYESATERLMSFLEQVSLVLQTTSPAHKKFIESTRAEVSAIARKTRGRNYSYYSSNPSSLSAISRAESMPSVVHDRHGESHLGKRNSSSSTSGSMCSLNSSPSPFEDHPLTVMTLGRKIKRSQSTQSKVGLPIVDEEVNSLTINSSLLSLSRKEQPHSSSTPIKPIFAASSSSSSKSCIKKSESRRRKDSSVPSSSKSPSSDNNTSTESADDVIHCYTVTPSHEKHSNALNTAGTPAQKEDLFREEVSKTALKLPSTPLRHHLQQSQRSNLSCENIVSIVDDDPTTPSVSREEETKDDLRIKAQKMLRSMKCILAREKTLNITPKRTHNLKSSKHGYHRQSLQLLSHQSSFPGLPSFPVLAVSHTSPWNC